MSEKIQMPKTGISGKVMVFIVLFVVFMGLYGCYNACSSLTYTLFYETKIEQRDAALERRINEKLDRMLLDSKQALP